MTQQTEILQRLERIEAMLEPMAASAASMQELRKDIAPRVNEGVKALILELAEIEGDVQLDEILALMKQMARSTKNISAGLKHMNALFDLVATAEPLLRTTVPHAIEKLDQLERDNVFKLLGTMLSVLQRIGGGYSEEQLRQMEENLPRLVAALELLLDNRSIEFLERAAVAPGCIDWELAGKAGFGSLVRQMRDRKTQQSMAAMLQMLQALAPQEAKDA